MWCLRPGDVMGGTYIIRLGALSGGGGFWTERTLGRGLISATSAQCTRAAVRARMPLNTRSGGGGKRQTTRTGGSSRALRRPTGQSRGDPERRTATHMQRGRERETEPSYMWQSTTTTATLRRYDVVGRRSYDGKFVTTVPRRQDDGRRRRRGAAAHAGRDQRDGARARCETMQRYTHVVEMVRERSSESRSRHTHTWRRVEEGKDREECTRGHISMMMMIS